MRIVIAAFAVLLAACGPSMQSSDNVPDDNALPYGAIVAVGENWHLQADPADNAVSIYVEDGIENSGTWTPPQPVEGGYRLVADDITIDLTNGACELNSVPYPMRATVATMGAEYTGCAAMRWDYQLIALMPQIDACLTQAPSHRVISYAGQQPDGSVLVRMRESDSMMDCRVANGVASVTARNESLPAATESNAVFIRAGGDQTQNPGGECYQAPEVRGANNELLGWKLDPMGC